MSVEKVRSMLEDKVAYVRDGHVFCYANAAPAASFDYAIPVFLKQNESDVLLWKPHTVLGLRPEKCLESPWGAGCPTCNVPTTSHGRTS